MVSVTLRYRSFTSDDSHSHYGFCIKHLFAVESPCKLVVMLASSLSVIFVLVYYVKMIIIRPLLVWGQVSVETRPHLVNSWSSEFPVLTSKPFRHIFPPKN